MAQFIHEGQLSGDLIDYFTEAHFLLSKIPNIPTIHSMSATWPLLHLSPIRAGL